jgi:hypothetical protein
MLGHKNIEERGRRKEEGEKRKEEREKRKGCGPEFRE